MQLLLKRRSSALFPPPGLCSLLLLVLVLIPVLVLGGSQTLVLLLCESVCNVVISTSEGCACKHTCMLSSFLLVDHICVDVRDGCDAEGWEEEEEEECGPQRFLR